MTTISKAVFGIALLVFANIALAKYFTSLSPPGVKITQYFTHSGGGVTLYISGSVQNLDGCMVTNRVHLKGNLAGHQSMVSAALAAFSSGKYIGLHASGCETIPFWGGTQTVAIINNLWVFE